MSNEKASGDLVFYRKVQMLRLPAEGPFIVPGRVPTTRLHINAAELDEDEAEERGHRKIVCSRCRYRGWSEDTGGCPRCQPVDTGPGEDDEEEDT